MKTIEVFATEVLRKTKRKKRKKFIVKSVLSLFVVGAIAFFVGYSNIVPFEDIFRSTTYKRFMGSYVSDESSEKYASVKILNGDTAAFTFGDYVYPCRLENESSDTFTMTARIQEDEVRKDYELSLTFDGDQAKVAGALGEENVEVVLNLVEDRGVPSGYWSMFAMGNEDGSYHLRDGYNYMYLEENGDAYVGEGSTVWPAKFVAVGDKILQYIEDQFTDVSEMSLLEILPEEQFGHPAIRDTLQEADGPFILYFRPATSADMMDYDGGTFETDYIVEESEGGVLSEGELFNRHNIEWRLLPRYPFEERQVQCSIRLELKEGGSVAFSANGLPTYTMELSGKWIPIRERLLVILEKTHPVIGKAFVVYEAKSNTIGLEYTALTHVEESDVYKMGYHTFTYYGLEIRKTVYWGAVRTELISNELRYDREYVLNGWYGSGENPLAQNGKMSLIFRKNGKCEWYYYEDGEPKMETLFYDYFEMYEEVMFYGRSLYVVCGSQWKVIDELHFSGGRLESSDKYYNDYSNEVVYRYRIIFELQ